MNNNIAYTGNKGDKVHSDCYVTLELKKSGGIELDVQNKSQKLNEQSIQELANDILEFFKIKDAFLKIEDTGAIQSVIAARIEAAIKKIINTEKEYLLPIIDENKYESVKEKYRFTNLYVPGNTPKMMIKAGMHHSDAIIFDLEDSVVSDKKHEARYLIRNVLRAINFNGAERMVRLNPYPKGLEDLSYIVPHNVHVLVLPKCENAEHVIKTESEVEKIKEKQGLRSELFYMPVIESALGVERAFEIASSSENVVAMSLGLEDYTADIGTRRTKDAKESFYARTRIINACKAAKIQAIDSVFSDLADEEGFRETIKESKKLGFDGMGCIHPRQIKVVRESFAPDRAEIEEAMKIVHAYYEAENRGLGVVSLDNKMIDPPVVKRAQKNIDYAIYLGLISENWRDEFLQSKE